MPCSSTCKWFEIICTRSSPLKKSCCVRQCRRTLSPSDNNNCALPPKPRNVVNSRPLAIKQPGNNGAHQSSKIPVRVHEATSHRDETGVVRLKICWSFPSAFRLLVCSPPPGFDRCGSRRYDHQIHLSGFQPLLRHGWRYQYGQRNDHNRYDYRAGAEHLVRSRWIVVFGRQLPERCRGVCRLVERGVQLFRGLAHWVHGIHVQPERRQ